MVIEINERELHLKDYNGNESEIEDIFGNKRVDFKMWQRSCLNNGKKESCVMIT